MRKKIILVILFVCVLSPYSESFAEGINSIFTNKTSLDFVASNKDFIKTAKELIKKDFPVESMSLNYTDSSVYLSFKVEMSPSIQTENYYLIPALIGGHYPGPLDYIETELTFNKSTVMKIRINSLYASQYALMLIDETEVIKKSAVESIPLPINQNYPPNPPSISSSKINTKIEGNFDGFKNGKIFMLQNGQIWKQTSFDISANYKYNPKVTIFKDGSYYYMIVDGIDKKVKVEFIQ